MSKSQSNDIIQSVVIYIQAAADRLLASKFSDSAISTFRGAIAGQLRSASRRMVELAWVDGNGSGDVPYDIAAQYVDEQMGFLGDFAIQISENRGERKIPGGAFRAAMYGESLGQCYQKAYMRARGSRYGLPDLPAYPRDGQTVCLTNCRCQWHIVKRSNTQYEATWQLNPADHCPDCIDNARKWNPLMILQDVNSGEWSMFSQ
jgi:hypothetical protein